MWPVPPPSVTHTVLSLSAATLPRTQWVITAVPDNPSIFADLTVTQLLIVTVSDADGSPRTDLTDADFTVSGYAPEFAIESSSLVKVAPWLAISTPPGTYALTVQTRAPLPSVGDPTTMLELVLFIYVDVSKEISSWPYVRVGRGRTVTSCLVAPPSPDVVAPGT